MKERGNLGPWSRSATERRYRLIGFGILIVLSLLVVSAGAFLLLVEPGSFEGQLRIAFMTLVAICALLGFGILYLLLTIEKTFKAIRAKIGPDASSMMSREAPIPTGTAPSSPTATIEYGQESRDVEILEGIGSVFSRRLARNGIATLVDLRAASVREIATAAQVGEPVAHRWKLMAQLMLVREINAQAAELLVLCGVESLEELAREAPENLVRKARHVNAAHTARVYPADVNVALVTGWIDAAKAQTLPEDLPSDRGRFGRGKASA